MRTPPPPPPRSINVSGAVSELKATLIAGGGRGGGGGGSIFKKTTFDLLYTATYFDWDCSFRSPPNSYTTLSSLLQTLKNSKSV